MSWLSRGIGGHGGLSELNVLNFNFFLRWNMIYVLRRKMFKELGNNKTSVIEYLNKTLNLRNTIVGLLIEEDDD
jgi:hypothetical protein